MTCPTALNETEGSACTLSSIFTMAGRAGFACMILVWVVPGKEQDARTNTITADKMNERMNFVISISFQI
jgi:hypothetical protein